MYKNDNWKWFYTWQFDILQFVKNSAIYYNSFTDSN